MNFALWLPIFAAVLVALYHSLSDDGAASVLDHFGIAYRLPPSLLPFVILVFAVASGTVSSVVDGKGWQEAAAAAITTAIAGVFGAVTQHAIVNRTMPPPGAKVLIGCVLAFALQACALFTRANVHEAENLTKQMADCLVSKQAEPDAQAFAECGVSEAEALLAREHLRGARASTKLSACAPAGAK